MSKQDFYEWERHCQDLRSVIPYTYETKDGDYDQYNTKDVELTGFDMEKLLKFTHKSDKATKDMLLGKA